MKKIFLLTIFVAFVALLTFPVQAQNPPLKPVAQPQVVTDAFSLIVEVNALRAANGLPEYRINAILMGIAQQHAEFMSVNGTSHTGYGGTRPYQRALNAGYPLGGDLSQGGFISENITGGNNKSVQEAVLQWQGDAPHLHTMLSSDLQEIGAGVAIVGNHVYYVIDCARPTGSGQAQSTPIPGQTQAADGNGSSNSGGFSGPLARTIVPSTPQMDGKLYHVVGPGETLWLIAISYGVRIADIRTLNNMSETEAIYPQEKLLVRIEPTSIPVTSTAAITDTPQTTFTPASTLQQPPLVGTLLEIVSTPLPSLTPISPMSVPVAPISSDTSIWVLGIVVVAALVLAAIFVRAGRH